MPRDNFDPEYREALRQKLKALVRQTEREQLRYMDSVEGEDLSIGYRFFLKIPRSQIPELKRRLSDVANWALTFEEEPDTIELGATFLVAPLK